MQISKYLYLCSMAKMGVWTNALRLMLGAMTTSWLLRLRRGRAVANNQFLMDVFQACMMHEVEYLVVAVLNEYVCKPNGKTFSSNDYDRVKTFLETIYVSGRLQLPLKGILLMGY